MAIDTFPQLGRRTVPEFQFGLRVSRLQFTAPFGGSDRSIQLLADRWTLRFPLNNMEDPDRGIVESFLVRTLRANAGRFYCWNFSRPVPNGTAAGAGLVNGASQTGATLITDGWTASQVALFRPGDFFTVNGELKMITAQVSSNASGVATLTFEPPLRASPPDNAIIYTNKPTALFRLDDTQVSFNAELAKLSSYEITATEVFV